jgi:hypothetical protein
MSIGDDDISRTAPDEESGNRTCLVFGMIGGGLGSLFLLCGGCCFGMYYFRTASVAEDIRSDLQDNPVIAEHVGDIDSLEVKLTSSNPFQDDYVFRITGSQDSGTITANCVEDNLGKFRVMHGDLKLDNGDVYDLYPDGRDDLNVTVAGDFDDQFWSDTLSQEKIDRLVREDLADHPVIREHIGEIQRLASDMDLSVQEPGDIWIFEISGTRGKGRLRANCVLVSDNDMDVDSGVLMLDSGENVQLFSDSPMDPLPDETDATPEPTQP